MSVSRGLAKELQRAAAAVRNARAIIVTAGAGMGVDSGLPDFRGPKGFWKAYPHLEEKGLTLGTMSTPRWFRSDPQFAWGFFGHRYNLYRSTDPHAGFHILKEWGKKMDYGCFVFTSNVDGHFQKAGFDSERIVECHGTINYLQCVDPRVSTLIWPMPTDTVFDVNESTFRAEGQLPMGPPGIDAFPARPNILMFGDFDWVNTRSERQDNRFFSFQMSLQKEGGIPFVVVELGAGLAVPTVRMMGQDLVSGRNKGVLIRINPNEPEVKRTKDISLPMYSLEALEKIQELLSKMP